MLHLLKYLQCTPYREKLAYSQIFIISSYSKYIPLVNSETLLSLVNSISLGLFYLKKKKELSVKEEVRSMTSKIS